MAAVDLAVLPGVAENAGKALALLEGAARPVSGEKRLALLFGRKRRSRLDGGEVGVDGLLC